ncbi:MAG TPA: DNA gyrase inhibitor YacG [Hyphomicrobiales bacterium]|nr:DNA gyrase inhibitor YacG [Hyphomicrobiales bacterium]
MAGRKTGADSAKIEPLRPPRPCPICGKPSDRKAYPFCSARCADIDLNRWLKGSYAIPVVEEDGGTTPDDGID